MILAAHLLLAALGLPALAACLYLGLLTALSAGLPVPPPSTRRLRFEIVVPAHDEAGLICRCLSSLQRVDWPADRVRVTVVADNCRDATAALARAAGARVRVRDDPARPGKGHALRLAFEESLRAGWADAIAVVDADSLVSPNLLEAFAARLESGAHAVQADYGVLNPDESWRTRLLAVAHGAFHTVRSRGRERLGLSCGLRGNGWCVTPRALAAAPYRALSLTEDLEYGIALGLAGLRVAYAGEAAVDADMAGSEDIARRQRQRWEDGRLAQLRARALPLLVAAVRRRSAICLDLALDLLVLPLSYVALHLAAFGVLAAAASVWRAACLPWLAAALLGGAALAGYVLRGAQLGGGASGVLALRHAPRYVAWKLRRVLQPHDRGVWAPTRRENR